MTKIAALMAAAAMLAVAGCGSSDNSSSASGGGGGYGSSSKKKSTTAAASAPAKAGATDEIELYDNFFKPKTITGKPGTKMSVDLKNEGKAEHTFTIDSQKIDKELPGGKDTKVTFTIPKSGSVQFYCKYHKSLGMTGMLKAS